MLKRLAFALAILAATPAFAQQMTPQQQAMSELGSQIGLLRGLVADLQAKNLEVMKENADLKKQVDDLKNPKPNP